MTPCDDVNYLWSRLFFLANVPEEYHLPAWTPSTAPFPYLRWYLAKFFFQDRNVCATTKNFALVLCARQEFRYGDQTLAAGEHLAPGFSQWRLALAAWTFMYVCTTCIYFESLSIFYHCITLLVFSCLFCFCFLIKFARISRITRVILFCARINTFKVCSPKCSPGAPGFSQWRLALAAWTFTNDVCHMMYKVSILGVWRETCSIFITVSRK